MWGFRGGVIGLLVLAAEVYAILNIAQSTETNGTKVLWTVLVIALPVLGTVIWYFFGPRSKLP